MPISYYKYSERDVENQIDWSTIGKDFSTMLKTTADLREQKKAEIEKATQEKLKAVADAPTGLDERVTDKMINLSSQSQDYLLLMNRMLKSGQLSPKDYSIASQNLKTDVSALFDLSKKYQTEYATYLERSQSGIANPYETWNKEKIESFTNFSKLDFVINTPTGTLSTGIKKKDPITGMEIIDYNQTLPQLKWAQGVKIDKFKTDDAVKNIVGSLGEESRILMQGRTLTKISDITQRKDLDDPKINLYKLSEKNRIDAIVDTNPFNAQSILMMDKGINSETGNAYYLTDNPNDKGLATHDAILVIPDPANPGGGGTIPKLDDVQKNTVRDLLTQRVRIGLDKSMEGQYYEPRAKTGAEIDEENRRDEAKNLGIQLARMLTGSQAQSESGGNYIINIPGFGRVEKDGAEVFITRNGERIPNNITGRSPEQAFRQLVSVFKTLGYNEQDIIKSGIPALGRSLNLTSKFDYSVGTEPKANPLADFNKYINNNISRDIVTDDQDQTVSNINQKYGKYGYTTKATGIINDVIEITAPNGTTKKEFKLNSKDVAKQIADWMKGSADIKKIGTASVMGATNESTGELD